MSSKEQALKDLRETQDHIETWLQELEEEELLPIEIWEPLSHEFVMLQGKHIPPEMCGEIKLWERIEELNNLIEDINEKLAEHGTNKNVT